MKSLFIIISVLTFNCIQYKKEQTEDQNYKVRIINVENLSDAFLLTGFYNGDTLKIVSFTTDLLIDDIVVNRINLSKADSIINYKQYSFDLIKPKQVRVDYVTRLNTIVIGRDTIWKSYGYENMPFYSKNSRGLHVETK